MTHKTKTMLLGPDNDNASMRVEIFVLCETAQEFAGRLNLLGTFEAIQIPALPFICPAMTVAIRMRFWSEEGGCHRCAVRLIDADGQAVLHDVETDFVIRAEDGSPSGVFNLIVRLQCVPFESPGEYSLDLYLDNELEASLPLKLNLVQQGN